MVKLDREDWGIEGPTGKEDKESNKTIAKIEEKVKELREKLSL